MGWCAILHAIARQLAVEQDSLPQVVADYLLFSFLVAVVDPRTTRIFGIGDGVWAVNGLLRVRTDRKAGRLVPAELFTDTEPFVSAETGLLCPDPTARSI